MSHLYILWGRSDKLSSRQHHHICHSYCFSLADFFGFDLITKHHTSIKQFFCLICCIVSIMNSSSVNSEFRRSEKGNSEEYFCQCPVQSEIYNFRSAALCLSSHFLCGTVSCAVSMATIWLESFAAGAGVFLGSALLLTAIIGFQTIKRNTGSIILLILVNTGAVMAVGITLAATVKSYKQRDRWCMVNEMIYTSDTDITTSTNQFFENRCKAGLVIDVMTGVCSAVSLLVCIALYVIAFKGLPSGKR
ncbi:uncharacterized protein [Apostichopus japonicus]|uniref:uncharacterized protein n=1 Tax=Stichopus japonicus TaxID=307972 RepID=UPI003AB5B5BB